MCKIRGRLRHQFRDLKKPVTVGDDVEVLATSAGEGVIEAIGERRTELARPSAGNVRKKQLLCANVDQVLVVVSVREPPLRHAFIDRILIAAQRGGIAPIVCLNKIDLDIDGAVCRELAVYEEVGYRVVRTSAVEGRGLVDLRDVLEGRTTVLAGHSGVGKSSLLTALQPDLRLETGDISSATGKGRHTTTAASLLPLEFGGYVVDTPGVRAFGLIGLEGHEVAHHYPEMRPLIDDCRFKSCTHTHEPDCAVKEALAGGRIPPLRYDSYRKILASIEAGLEGEERVYEGGS